MRDMKGGIRHKMNFPFNELFRKPLARSNSVQISPDTRSRDGDFKDSTAFGTVDENEDKLEEFERVVGEQKKMLDMQKKVIEEQTRKLIKLEKTQEENYDLEI